MSREYYNKYVELRDRKGVKDADVARATGINNGTFSEWKKGLYTPKTDKLLLIAKYFEVPLETLLEES